MCLCLDRGEHDATSPFSARSNDSRFDRWNTLLNQLRKWHGRRVVELRALVELEDHESTFPVVLFSSSAGMLANAIYHTAMSLLLSRQPRDVALCDNIDKDWAESAEASRIWHARRVCGIAVNSTEQYAESWDPCMIAAFFCAAKCMTEQAQQKDLIACLEAIKTAGWRVDKLIHKLHREWGL